MIQIVIAGSVNLMAHFWAVNRRLIFKAYYRLKNKLIRYHSNARSTKTQDNSRPSYTDWPWIISRNQQPKYPPIPERPTNSGYRCFGYSAFSRDNASHSWNCNCAYSFASSIQFFIKEERRHYQLLNANVFGILRNVSSYSLNPVYSNDDSVISRYSFQTLYYYDDAVLHMKKDKGKLDELTNKPFAKIVEFNNASDKANPEINRLILDGMHEAGFDENDETQSQAISDINRLTRRHLRDIYHAEDLRAKANTFDVKMSAKSLSDLTQNTIISLVRNDHIIEQMSSVKEIYNDIIRMLDPIKEQAKAISQAIENDVYDTRVDCCPTYWTLLKRFV